MAEDWLATGKSLLVMTDFDGTPTLIVDNPGEGMMGGARASEVIVRPRGG